MEAANITVIVLAVLLGIVLVVGIYKFFKNYFSQHSSLNPYDQSAKRRQTLKTVLTVLVSIAALVAVFFAYHYFTTQQF